MSDSSSTPPDATSAPRKHRRLWLRLPLYVFLVYAAWCAMLYFAQGRLLFRVDMVRPLNREEMALRDRAVCLKLDVGDGGQVEGFFLPAPQATESHPAPVVIFFHGNAERAEFQTWFVQEYHALGCSVLLPEYRGYGESAGQPSEEAIVDDAVRFYDAILERPDVDRARIVLHGWSLGGGVAAQLAARRKPAALILESTFTSVAAFCRRYLAPTMLAAHPFRTDQVLSTLDVPVLIAHGTRDRVIPVEHGRQLRELARNAVYIEYSCGHNDLPPAGREQEHWRRIAEFLGNSGVLPSRNRD